MKWLSVVTVSALVFFSNACEKHPTSELDTDHGAGAHPAGHTEHTEHKESAAHAEPEKKAEEAKPGEAPKFFPEKK